MAPLQIIIEGHDRTKAVEVEGILLQVKSFKFLVTLGQILSCTKSPSYHLHSINTDLAKASELVEVWKLCKHLEQMKKGTNITNT